MDIETQLLTCCEIAPGGEVISLGFVDSKGLPQTIRLTLNQVGALAMTLPGLIGSIGIVTSSAWRPAGSETGSNAHPATIAS